MNLKDWALAERGRSAGLSAYLKVPPSFVSKMLSGEKPVPIAHGAAIEVFTGGAVTRREMFPDDWARVWPELAETA